MSTSPSLSVYPTAKPHDIHNSANGTEIAGPPHAVQAPSSSIDGDAVVHASNQIRSEPDRRSRRVFSDGINDILGRKARSSRSSGGFLLGSFSGPSTKKRRVDKDGSAKSSRPTSGWWSNDASSMHGVSNGVAENNVAFPHVQSQSPSLKDRGSPRISDGSKGKGRASVQPSPPSDAASGSLRNSTPTSHTAMQGQPQGGQPYPLLSVDQSQLVQMALSLSESKRLHLSPGHLASVGSPGNRRSVSGNIGSPQLNLPDGFANRRRSFRTSSQHYHSFSMASPRASNVGDRTSQDHRLSSQIPGAGDEQQPSMTAEFDNTVSEATLMRAEKARLHFELSHEYRRLLNSLPPLKSNSSLEHERGLGRIYNPLQYIRNRQVRARERQTLDANAAGWNNLEAVRLWVDMVEVEAQDEASRSGDVQLLPSWNSRLRHSSTQSVAPWVPPEVQDPTTANTKPKWERLDWSITPADLLADAYWLEQGRNKALIEAGDGSRIFDRFNRNPERYKLAELSSRIEENRNHVQSERQGSPDSFDSSHQSPSRPQYGKKTAHLTHLKVPSTAPSGPVARVKRHLLHLHKDEKPTISESDISEPEDAGVQHFHKRGASKFDNTGPLEKHMKRMLASETSKPTEYIPERARSVEQDEVHLRRGGMSEDITNDVDEVRQHRQLSSSDYASARGSVEFEHLETPRISIEDTDAGQRRDWSALDSSEEPDVPMQEKDDVALKPKSRTFPLNFLRKESRLIEQERIDETDFAFRAENEAKRPSRFSRLSRQLSNSPRSSIDAGSRTYSLKSLELQRAAKGNGIKSQIETDVPSESKAPGSTGKRFFKGGRIGDIVRNERPRVSGFVWKRQLPRQDEMLASMQDDESSNSDAEEYVLARGRDGRRSHSASDLTYGNYNGEKLPTFKPINAQDRQKEHDAYESEPVDRISKPTQAEKKPDNTTPSNHPSSTNIRTKDVSPEASTRNLSRVQLTGSLNKSSEQLNRHPAPGDDRTYHPSKAAAQSAGKRLSAILSEPGGVGRGGAMITPLADYETSQQANTYPNQAHHHWSIADGAQISVQYSEGSVMQRDIAYVRSLLLSTGIKAQTIVERANSFRETPPAYLTEAARLCNASLRPVSRRQEHVIAARLLSSSLESSVSAFEEEAERFRGETCTQLYSRLDDLRERVGSKLTPLVRSCADDADAFTARLTTTHTLAIKQVNDSVDSMIQNRRRRLRWLRRAGFTMLEWVVVGIMWWIWLFVYVLKIVKGVVVAFGRGIGWMFWP